MSTVVEAGLQLNRQVGIEMEGYITTFPHDADIPNVKKKEDGSVRGKYWNQDDPEDRDGSDDLCDCSACRAERDEDDEGDGYGVELVTEPITDLTVLRQTFDAMQAHGWNTDSSAGTHIHVDISDFSIYEKAKLLRFGKGIERIIFLFVRDYRLGNGYCGKIDENWRKVFRKHGGFQDIDWEDMNNALSRGGSPYWDDISSYFRQNGAPYAENEKYTWLNVFSTRYPTAEFRIFNAVESIDQILTFSLMAHNIVELVKNSTVKQLNYIIRQLYAVDTPEEAAGRLCQSIGLGFVPSLIGQKAYDRLKTKLERQKEEAQGA